MRRRDFLRTAGALAATGAGGRLVGAPLSGRPPLILLRPGTAQHGNIGDIAHTPGALRLFARHFPEAQFILWPVAISPEARRSLRKEFPNLRIVEGELEAGGRPSTQELQTAWAESDLLLHGSAPGFKGGSYLPAWRAASAKPYGIFGITHDPVSSIANRPAGGTLRELGGLIDTLPRGHLRPTTHELLSGAAFIFCRETLSAKYLRAQAVRSPVIEFGPDATFALQWRKSEGIEAYLAAQGLEPGKFICVIPRLRYTPYHQLQGRPPTAADLSKEAVNERTVEEDHAKLRALMVHWVQQTGLKVLACPEMSYQIALARDKLVAPLPEKIRNHVVWRDSYWLPAEAASAYARAAAVISFECHSPILALRQGTPAIYVRQPTDTIKGQMYHDLGLSDWTCEVDEVRGSDLWDRVAKIRSDAAGTSARLHSALATVESRQRRMVEAVRNQLT